MNKKNKVEDSEFISERPTPFHLLKGVMQDEIIARYAMPSSSIGAKDTVEDKELREAETTFKQEVLEPLLNRINEEVEREA